MNENDPALHALQQMLLALPEATRAEVLRNMQPKTVPTVGDYVTKARAAYAGRPAPNRAARRQKEKSNTYRTYDTHWKRLEEEYGDQPVTAPQASDVIAFVNAAQDQATETNRQRGEARAAKGAPHKRSDGTGARNSALNALRAVFRLAVLDDARRDNPCAGMKSTKKASLRRSLTDLQLEALLTTAGSTGDDPELDYLITVTHYETGCRQGGPLELRVQDVDVQAQMVLLREKGRKERWQPVSRELAERLLTFARSRGAVLPTDAVFRYRMEADGSPGDPITSRRYDNLHGRWQEELDWAGREGVTTHWIRHSMVTRIDARAGKIVAGKFAGHEDQSVTAQYIHLPPNAVHKAISEELGYTHPAVPTVAPAATG